MFGQFGSKKNPCNMRFMHYHSMHYDNFYCIYGKDRAMGHEGRISRETHWDLGVNAGQR